MSLEILTQKSLEKEVFHQLEKVRKEKKAEIYELLDNLRQTAFGIKNDIQMKMFFDHIMAGKGIAEIEYLIDVGYVKNYGNFYDILFVDHLGIVRHSIKREPDYLKNLFLNPFADSIFSRTLKESDTDKFAEFAFYPPSNEPAAFFIVPIESSGAHLGWIALQLAANSLNSVLNDRTGLGKTGEVYLVNEQKMMLTDSRFSQKSTILRKKIATQAVKLGYANGTGEKLIDDYRGTPVYSSFEQIDVFGARWLLIAEIDEAEVLTNYYSKRSSLLEKILTSLASTKPNENTAANRFSEEVDTRVDMNEFKKITQGRLITYGVATCTAVAVIHPDNFSYLAHLSPADAVFMESWSTSLGLGRYYTNLLEEMFTEIFHYDILPYQKKELQVVIVVPRKESIGKVVDVVLEQGLELGNIRLMYNGKGDSANVILDAEKNSVLVEWKEDKKRWSVNSNDYNSLDFAMKGVLKD